MNENTTPFFTKNESSNPTFLLNKGTTPENSQHFEPISSTDTTISHNNLDYEKNRLRTFNKSWPKSFVNTQILAKFGFYFTGTGDRVKCHFCQIEVCDWDINDNVVTEHLRWSPNCPLLRRHTTTNVPIGPIMEFDQLLIPINNDFCNIIKTLWRPYFLFYANETDRFRSFEKWPISKKQSAKQMSEAGYFYTQKDDEVICFMCGGGLCDWDETDDPWTAHARYYENCTYLRMIKGSKFIESIKNKTMIPGPHIENN